MGPIFDASQIQVIKMVSPMPNGSNQSNSKVIIITLLGLSAAGVCIYYYAYQKGQKAMFEKIKLVHGKNG
jgi:hypothetical protein